jgi:hypothetical protein
MRCVCVMLQELDEMKKRLKEMEEEAAALREMQAKVEKEMGAVQGSNLFLCSFPFSEIRIEFSVFSMVVC